MRQGARGQVGRTGDPCVGECSTDVAHHRPQPEPSPKTPKCHKVSQSVTSQFCDIRALPVLGAGDAHGRQSHEVNEVIGFEKAEHVSSRQQVNRCDRRCVYRGWSPGRMMALKHLRPDLRPRWFSFSQHPPSRLDQPGCSSAPAREAFPWPSAQAEQDQGKRGRKRASPAPTPLLASPADSGSAPRRTRTLAQEPHLQSKDGLFCPALGRSTPALRHFFPLSLY